MYYKSTRDSSVRVESAVAISQGISADGGLFVPEQIPSITKEELAALADKIRMAAAPRETRIKS